MDVDRLTDILRLARGAAGPRRERMSHVYCPECGYQNPETANFCAKCGSHLKKEEAGEQTLTFTPDELADDPGAVLRGSGGAGDPSLKGPALVVRSGGGRAGETFLPSGERTLIGRSPDCDVFLDDVTVSRKHAELLQTGERFTIKDLGSLNGPSSTGGGSRRTRPRSKTTTRSRSASTG